MNSIVSIIVPVYKAEATLQRCIDSALSQKYTDIQLVLVFDGDPERCPDQSAAICRKAAAQDERVTLVDTENKGVSSNRNKGLDAAVGDYIQFIDADDWITPDATMLMAGMAERDHCDLVISDFYRVVKERLARKGDIAQKGIMSLAEYSDFMMKNPADYYYGVLWNKLYRRDIIEQYRLRMDEDVSWCEDFLFNLEYLRHTERIEALQVPVYYYVKTPGSLVSQQGMSLSRTAQMKRDVFKVYHDYFRSLLSEEEYKDKRPQIYSFLVDSAIDGAVPVGSPKTNRLGSERITLSLPAIAWKGVLNERCLAERLLDNCLEPICLKYSLSMIQIRILACFLQDQTPRIAGDIADLMGIKVRQVRYNMQRLLSTDIMVEFREQGETVLAPSTLTYTVSPGAEMILEDIRQAMEACEAMVFADFSGEEKAEYERMQKKINEKTAEILQKFAVRSEENRS